MKKSEWKNEQTGERKKRTDETHTQPKKVDDFSLDFIFGRDFTILVFDSANFSNCIYHFFFYTRSSFAHVTMFWFREVDVCGWFHTHDKHRKNKTHLKAICALPDVLNEMRKETCSKQSRTENLFNGQICCCCCCCCCYCMRNIETRWLFFSSSSFVLFALLWKWWWWSVAVQTIRLQLSISIYWLMTRARKRDRAKIGQIFIRFDWQTVDINNFHSDGVVIL